MKWVFVAASTIAGLIVAIGVIGLLLPVKHRAARSMWLPQSPETLFAVIRDVEAYSRWRPDVRQVERFTLADGSAGYREAGAHGTIAYAIVLEEPPYRLVTCIADPELPFGGQWSVTLTAEGAGTRVTVVEDGEVRNPFFRFMAKFVFGHHRTMESYLRALGRKFETEVDLKPA